MTTTLPARLRTGLTVDIALFTVHDRRLHVLAIRRGKPPYRGAVALPGGFVEKGEAVIGAALRELGEEAGLAVPAADLERVGVYGARGRDPRGWMISVAFAGYVPEAVAARAGSDARAVEWVPVDVLRSPGTEVAFDHRAIVRDAVTTFRDRLQYTAVALDFLPSEFTLDELRGVYEAVWGRPLGARGFADAVLGAGGFVERHGAVYRRGASAVLVPPIARRR
ncbi:NUDIX hydrolase [Actinosynnema sp. NPDC047251]|uniref:Nudix hydrolase domain-containing protein n=1 Tax=Saccharothrix espanaensis (strain ATCC 51144 / DSM 44229 / JCM 9112 / NBRC 15066 / NRRL 15764) TaxID=1179773 RepID=K0JYS0_SACES|nr:NUDIX hydrolase [Saccharothrix espanaensis]CCH29388.1 hypothetical protein BN6_20670 [Saccharothrix espanaensis DSM 44229]